MKPGSRYAPSASMTRSARSPASTSADRRRCGRRDQHVAFDHVEGVVHGEDGGVADDQRRALRLGDIQRSERGLERLGLAAPDRDQLGDDADGDLLRRDGADVEADRRVDALELLAGRRPSSTSSCS